MDWTKIKIYNEGVLIMEVRMTMEEYKELEASQKYLR